MLALAHDQRVMREDRGFLCLPEVDIRIPFTPGMAALIQARLPPHSAHEAMTTGRRYGGQDAQAAEIVDEVLSEDALVSRAVELVGALAERTQAPWRRSNSACTPVRSRRSGLFRPASERCPG